ncbi:MAG: trehalose-phosphatase, partial [Thermoanaerobaculia bacterium]|nr:trehalose-phosphatase [Thermoanaerobaculia bacterium]
GTLAPIQLDPTTVRIYPAALSFFEWAAKQEGVEIALISGRDLDDLRSRTEGIDAWRSGSHGQEIEDPSGELVVSAPPRTNDPSADWENRAGDAGLRIEKKKFGIAVHWRGVDGVDDDHPLIREFETWAKSNRLETTHGRRVIEAAVPGASKKSVLERLVSETGAERVVYAGDDVTDLSAIELAANLGRGFFVKSREREAEFPSSVEVVPSTDVLLAKMKEEVLGVRP